MKTFKFSLVLRTCENTDGFITLDENIYGIHSKRVNILYVSQIITSVTTLSGIMKAKQRQSCFSDDHTKTAAFIKFSDWSDYKAMKKYQIFF